MTFYTVYFKHTLVIIISKSVITLLFKQRNRVYSSKLIQRGI
jgi:hypothetical protein